MCLLGALLCVCGVLGHLAPVHRCAGLVRCFACAVSWAYWLLFTGVPEWFVPKALLPKGKGRDVYPRVQVNGLGCVCCVRAVCKCDVA